MRPIVSAVDMQRRLHEVRGRGARRVSEQTVRNRLHADGLRSRSAAVKPGLTRRHERLRLAWGREKREWTREQWANCLFCDESRFCLAPDDNTRRVWRRRRERRHHPNLINRREAFGGGGVMVWGAIGHNYKSDLVFIEGSLTAARYLDTILRPHVRPYAGAIGPDNFVLVDDNALPHRGRVVNAFLDNEGIQRIDWPPKSPDSNPIERLGDHEDADIAKNEAPIYASRPATVCRGRMGKRVHRRYQQVRSFHEHTCAASRPV